MLLKVPFELPPDFLGRFGYHRGRRFVALYWEPCGDESCYDDGVADACGLTDNWLFAGFVFRPDVAEWFGRNRLHLGNSEEAATDWLLVDGATGEVYVGPWREVRRTVIWQQLPG